MSLLENYRTPALRRLAGNRDFKLLLDSERGHWHDLS
jgi:hypothetical protein